MTRLEKEAALLLQQERGGVISKIKVAIEKYRLVPDELFGSTKASAGKRTVSQAVKATATTAGKKAATKAAAKSPSKIRYRDDKGNQWTGHGKRPGWYLNALASGKTPEDLLVN